MPSANPISRLAAPVSVGSFVCESFPRSPQLRHSQLGMNRGTKDPPKKVAWLSVIGRITSASINHKSLIVQPLHLCQSRRTNRDGLHSGSSFLELRTPEPLAHDQESLAPGVAHNNLMTSSPLSAQSCLSMPRWARKQACSVAGTCLADARPGDFLEIVVYTIGRRSKLEQHVPCLIPYI